MMAGSHVALGAAAWIAAAPQFGLPALAPASIGLAVLGALLPDVDHPKSWVGRRLRPLSSLIGATFGHRGVTHSLLAVAAFCVLLLRDAGLPRGIVAPLAVGYLSHLAADLLTPGGLRLAWPFRGTYALPLCRTGSVMEPLVVAGILLWVGAGLLDRPAVGEAVRSLGLCRVLPAAAAPCRPETVACPCAARPRARAPARPGPVADHAAPRRPREAPARGA